MPLNTSKSDGNWLVDINAVDRNGKQIYMPDGKPSKTKVQMEDATLGPNSLCIFHQAIRKTVYLRE
jgi:hypothetical protein